MSESREGGGGREKWEEAKNREIRREEIEEGEKEEEEDRGIKMEYKRN